MKKNIKKRDKKDKKDKQKQKQKQKQTVNVKVHIDQSRKTTGKKSNASTSRSEGRSTFQQLPPSIIFQPPTPTPLHQMPSYTLADITNSVSNVVRQLHHESPNPAKQSSKAVSFGNLEDPLQVSQNGLNDSHTNRTISPISDRGESRTLNYNELYGLQNPMDQESIFNTAPFSNVINKPEVNNKPDPNTEDGYADNGYGARNTDLVSDDERSLNSTKTSNSRIIRREELSARRHDLQIDLEGKSLKEIKEIAKLNKIHITRHGKGKDKARLISEILDVMQESEFVDV